MPEYHFTGTSPRVLTGLSQGVNALLLPTDRPTPPYGSTIEANPGDSLETSEPYIHPELVLAEAAPADPEPVVPIQLVAADSTPEQIAAGLQAVQDAAAAGADGLDVLNAAAHDAMTAEGAPAPAEPTN